MTASNHMITGALIALAVKQPILVIPLAFASHFILDALPHFGFPGKLGFPEALRHKPLTFTMEFIGIIGLIILAQLLYDQAWIVWLAAFVALSPDLMWPYVYIFFERKDKPHPLGPISQFHHNIQWCERPWGIFVEISWFIGVFVVLQRLL